MELLHNSEKKMQEVWRVSTHGALGLLENPKTNSTGRGDACQNVLKRKFSVTTTWVYNCACACTRWTRSSRHGPPSPENRARRRNGRPRHHAQSCALWQRIRHLAHEEGGISASRLTSGAIRFLAKTRDFICACERVRVLWSVGQKEACA